MKLNLQVDRNDSFSARVDGHLFVLSKSVNPAHIKDGQEYMIVSRLGKHPKGWIVEPVIEGRHVLVNHDGFAMEGSMCTTTAFAPAQKLTITPGRLHGILRNVCHVNARIDVDGVRRLTYGDHAPVPDATPGVCYVESKFLPRDNRYGMTRLVGVPDLTDLVDVPTAA